MQRKSSDLSVRITTPSLALARSWAAVWSPLAGAHLEQGEHKGQFASKRQPLVLGGSSFPLRPKTNPFPNLEVIHSSSHCPTSIASRSRLNSIVEQRGTCLALPLSLSQRDPLAPLLHQCPACPSQERPLKTPKHQMEHQKHYLFCINARFKSLVLKVSRKLTTTESAREKKNGKRTGISGPGPSSRHG